MMGLDLTRYIKNEEQQKDCEHTKDVASKYGIQVICDETDTEESQPTLHLPETEDCEHSKEVASKYGVQVICDEEAADITEERQDAN